MNRHYCVWKVCAYIYCSLHASPTSSSLSSMPKLHTNMDRYSKPHRYIATIQTLLINFINLRGHYCVWRVYTLYCPLHPCCYSNRWVLLFIYRQEVVGSVSYTTEISKMMFTTSYLVYRVNFLVCLLVTRTNQVGEYNFSLSLVPSHPCPSGGERLVAWFWICCHKGMFCERLLLCQECNCLTCFCLICCVAHLQVVSNIP